jgi:hypothetical protein
MKQLFTTFALALSLPVLAQTDLTPRPRGYNTLGITSEIGGGLVPANYVMTYPFETKEHVSVGHGILYERQFNFSRRSGLVIGIGANFTQFSSHLLYRNSGSFTFTYTTPSDTVTHELQMAQHDLGRVKHFYLSLDFPILYTHTFDLGTNWKLTPYIGVKFRNIFLIDAESTFRGHAIYAVETDEATGDTTFAMTPAYRSRMYDNRIVVLPTLGVRSSKVLPNGGMLNFFADYSLAMYNNIEMRYYNLDNTERVEVKVTENGETTTEYQTIDFDYLDNTTPLIMALKMSHMRAGISYTLPNRK